jgi:translation initiation factor 1
VRITRETKGRGGKAVTVISGLPVTPEELKVIAKKIKQRCGVGGSAKEATIEIQGDQRTVCKDALEALGYTCKLAGG